MTTRSDQLLRVEGLSKFFPVLRGVFGKAVAQVRAVDDVSFEIRRGETLGLVGESGCGKTTAGRSILRLIEPSAGRVWFDGADVTRLSQPELRQYRRRMQIIFQDPFGSLNPRMRVVDILGEPIERHGLASGAGVEARVRELLGQVGLSERWVNRYPHEFSGGQRQRVGIARAIAVAPELIVCDEAVSALDVSIQAQVINLLIDLRREMGLSYLFIAHDLSVVRHISDRVAVMYLGEIVELARCDELFERPAHPYTRALLSAIPLPDPRKKSRRVVLQGDVPTPLNPPAGCHFHPRCPAALERCSEADPPVVRLQGGQRLVRCVHAVGLEDERDFYRALERRIGEAIAAGARDRAPQRTRLPLLSTASPPEPSAQGLSPGPSAPLSPSPRSSRLPDLLSLLTLALGFAGLVMGRYGVGLAALAIGAITLAPSPPEPLRRISRRRPVLALTAALLIVGVVLSRWLEPARLTSRARADLGWLQGEIAAHARNVGKAPESLSALRWRTLERFGPGAPRDPWGRPYRYEAQADLRFTLSSDGADGVPSGDDIRP